MLIKAVTMEDIGPILHNQQQPQATTHPMKIVGVMGPVQHNQQHEDLISTSKILNATAALAILAILIFQDNTLLQHTTILMEVMLRPLIQETTAALAILISHDNTPLQHTTILMEVVLCPHILETTVAQAILIFQDNTVIGTLPLQHIMQVNPVISRHIPVLMFPNPAVCLPVLQI